MTLNCNYQLNFITYNKFLEKLDEKNKLNEEIEINTSTLVVFLEEIKTDYKSCGLQFHTALDKFAKHYHASKLKSVPCLFSFLYDISQNVDPTCVKSGAMIYVQVKSVKWHKKIGLSNTKQVNGKENLNP
ncbi:hypothetical protein RhiirA5_505112 [Rhizophagus irregularis]|uniref:Uncharacterized protein n=1 Tax=Rhizophagus irregularis TaxID=588596 RepID=A0A2I1F6H3_9GLOM|nr:hypothetical protein RhiirA5_505112 [Rhizophagus irregularis]PKC57624.1 hypothetical protein RhiirA1_401268 [Rhizophagus irregularis]PKY29984.1 hypothetical protein RhiirB3_392226 [Rhizophagus irregularis]CAB5202523.1 unnamed protein product [Rhizophagus irregularis]CAB5365269.1 unnamed protein product [Rhizophagus irregularis]